MNKSKLIKQPYHLTVSEYQYSVYEERIFLSILDELQPYFSYKTNFIEYINKLKDSDRDVVVQFKVKKLMKSSSCKKYKEVEKALDGLISKKIKMKGEDKVYGKYNFCSSLILEYKYFLSREMVRLKISSEMMSLLCASLSNYTRYSLKVAFNCSSPYSIRIYKYISHYRDFSESKKTLSISTETLRRWLCLGDKYRRAISIKQKILDPAQRDLKEKADIWFSIKEPIKEGRKVIGWKIQIHKKKGVYTQPRAPSTTTKAKGTTANQHAQERANLLAIRDRWKDKIDLP